MHRPSNVAAMVSLLALVSSVAVAQGPPPDAGRSAEMIHKHDLNGDGRLSDAEIEASRPRGAPMGPRERGKSPPPGAHGIACDSGALRNDVQIQALLEEFDGDGDGKLDLAEMGALRSALRTKSDGFRRVGKDGDEAEDISSRDKDTPGAPQPVARGEDSHERQERTDK